ncbi:hypothetical protein H6F89_30825 [Cyanobacteria bacterium FACHB-63]|nr:hypothetical protein [Cyanobacteria bacterium FACHB-63]
MIQKTLSLTLLTAMLTSTIAVHSNLNSQANRAIAAQQQTKPLPQPTSAPKPLALIFNQTKDDMPAVRLPKGYDGCNRDEEEKIKQAWKQAHFYMWRADQLMDYLDRHDKYRKEMWSDGYVAHIKNGDGKYVNYSPRGWFGPYDGDRFQKVRGAINKVWHERFLGKTFTVECRTKDSNKGSHPCYIKNPQTGNRPSANHIAFGTINFCKDWFDDSVSWRAQGVIHEVFHWLKLPNSALWVSDIHDYWAGSCLKYRAANSLYGDEAAYIANEGGCNGWNYNRTPINNDNYALFAYMFGKAVWDGKTMSGASMTQFPSKNFKW